MNERPKFYQPILVALLCLNFGILFFDRNALNFLMPFVQPALALSNTQVGILASAFSLTWAIAGVLIGSFSDRTGFRKPILIFVTVMFAACSALSGIVTTFLMLFAVRLLMGIAEGGVLPVSQALTVAEVSPVRRGFAMGFMQNFGSNLLGSTAASLILVPFAVHFGWRRAFFLAAIPGVVSAVLIAWFVREPPRAALVQGATAAQLTTRAALGNRNILLCVLISILHVSHPDHAFVFLPLYLINVRGYSPATMSVLIGVLGVSAAKSSVLCSLPAGPSSAPFRFSWRRSHRRPSTRAIPRPCSGSSWGPAKASAARWHRHLRAWLRTCTASRRHFGSWSACRSLRASCQWD
jgi:MFS family permease